MSKTDHTENEPEIKSNGHEPELELSTEEKIKAVIEKYKPYILRLWKVRRKLVMVNLIVAVLTVLYLLFIAKPYFVSTITILPDYGSKSSMLGSLGGLAAVAGVNIGESDPSGIYQNLIFSESVLKPVVYTKYKTEKYSEPVDLIRYFEIDPDESLEPELQKRDMFLQLFKILTKGKIKTDIDKFTKILTVTVVMPESKLSSDVVNKIAEKLDLYVRTQRKSYATEQSFYIEKRVKQVYDSLTISEERLKNYREQNRMVEQSPRLMLEQARLMRTVEILQTVYGELIKQLEISKIDEIKDVPVINIEESSEEPIKKAGPSRMIILIIICFFTLIISSMYLIFLPEIKKYIILVKGKYTVI
jgi:uncharacterized protein involved in exopolysaccharide biosynthesis